MPPHVPRKRLREESPQRNKPARKGRATATAIAPPRKPTLFDDLDSTISPKSKDKTSKQVIELSDDDDSSSLSSLSDADFEDVPGVKRQKTEVDSGKDDEDEDEDIEFEDVSYPTLAPRQAHGPNEGPLELTLSHVPTATYADFGGKKGPSKKERQARIATHCMHVQFLMWHNAIRNAWLCDPVTQGIVLSHLSPGVWDEIERFRRSCGLDLHEETSKGTTKRVSKGKASGKATKASEKAAKDWGGAAQRLENGAVDLSHGDPLFRLVRSLSAWWRKRFRVTAPGLRKLGYMQTRRCASLIKGFNEGGINPDRYGERVSNLQWFRLRAQECTGSRDVGAQLFTCLLRAIGLEARMTANLQPVGFGFNKTEEAEADKISNPSVEENHDTPIAESSKAKGRPAKKAPSKNTKASQAKKQPRQSGRSLRKQGRRSLIENSNESDDDDLQLTGEDSADNSAVEIPPLTPAKDNNNRTKFDRDLEFPYYWTEVLSPATHKYVPVDAIAKNVLGTNRDLVESLGPRGAKADKAKQVIAYVVSFNQDGTAKDVTVRYLKGQLFPGRTKGTRMPLEKIPVYNKNGKIKRYDHFDWFKSVLRGFERGGENCPLTEVDYDEDATDLKIAQPVKKEVKEGEETLQYFKSSKEFVLARHLKREEALLPTAEPVKYFKNKGNKGDGEEEAVYLRKDVVQVKSEETWHKQGRAPKPGSQPLKQAPFRAATTNRRRELAEAEAAAGHKVLQGLYSYDQTDWIIPPPIQNGIIPKNQYGNIDLFVENMLPKGAAHVPYRAAIRVCKRLEIDFAEAVVDFEFGHRMAVPVIQGVVIPEEHYDQVMEEVAKEEAEKARKEDEKRRKVVLGAWRKLLMGMRIVERVRREYGDLKDSFQVFGHSRDDGQNVPDRGSGATDDEDMAGGFLPGGFDEEEEEEEEEGDAEAEDRGAFHKSSFFPAIEDDEDGGDEGDVGLVIEDGGASTARVASPASQSRDMSPPRRAPLRRTRQKGVPSSEDEDEDEDDDHTDSDDGEYEE